MAMGQAAGTAAAVAAATGVTPREVSLTLLRDRLGANGVLMEPLEPAEVED
jgi:hypothetical protein